MQETGGRGMQGRKNKEGTVSEREEKGSKGRSDAIIAVLHQVFDGS